MPLVLEPVAADNWRDCAALTVLPDRYAPDNTFTRPARPRAPSWWPVDARVIPRVHRGARNRVAGISRPAAG
jgi:hypothetical protein